MSDKKFPFLANIGAGIVRALPVVWRLAERKKQGTPADAPVSEPRKMSVTATITELIMVGLIVAFAFGKITIDDLLKLLAYFGI